MTNFQWDVHNIGHIARHHVIPEEVETAYDDPQVLIAGVDTRGGEWHLTIIGRAHTGRLIMVVATPRDQQVRPVTAYPASRRWQQAYLLR